MLDKNLCPEEVAAILALCKRNFAELSDKRQICVNDGFWAQAMENGLLYCFLCNKEVKITTALFYAAAAHAREHLKKYNAFI